MKRKTEVKFRHKVFSKVFKFFLYPYIKLKFKYQYKKYRNLKKEGPYIILSNHTMAFDPILISFSFNFPIYYIATEQIFNLGFLSKMLKYLVNPISKSKSESDLLTIRKARRIVSEGGSIAVYPEGNVSYDGAPVTINKSIIKLIRLLKIPVIIYNTEGLYLSDPRWAHKTKHGKTKGYINTIIKKAEYDKLDDDAFYELLLEHLNVNAYTSQENELLTYKGKELALGLERLVFMDLKTNKPFVNYTKGNKLYSKDSDFELTYLNTGYVLRDNQKTTLVDLNKEVIDKYYNYYLTSNDNFITEEEVSIELTSGNKKVKEGKHLVKLYKDKVIITGNSNEETYFFKDISSLAIQGKRKIIIYNEKTLLLTLNDNSSPYKYLLTYQFYKKGEQNTDENNEFYQFGL